MLRSIVSFLGMPFVGLVILAGAFVQLDYGRVRLIANNDLPVTSMNELLLTLFKDRIGTLQGFVEGVMSRLWQLLILLLTLNSAAAICTILPRFRQPIQEPIGFDPP